MRSRSASFSSWARLVIVIFCGAKSRTKAKSKPRAQSLPPEVASQAKYTSRRRGAVPGKYAPKLGEDQKEWRERTRRPLVSGADAEATIRGRETAWDQWRTFLRGKDPYLDTSTQEDLIASENRLLDWVAHLAFTLGRKASTV